MCVQHAFHTRRGAMVRCDASVEAAFVNCFWHEINVYNIKNNILHLDNWETEISVIQGNVLVDKVFGLFFVFVYFCVPWKKKLVSYAYCQNNCMCVCGNIQLCIKDNYNIFTAYIFIVCRARWKFYQSFIFFCTVLSDSSNI